MTLTFNEKKYQALLVTYVPKTIKTEEDNEQALKIIEELMHKKRTPEEDELYQLLITLIEKFEQEYYQINSSINNNSNSILEFLLEQSGKSKVDLINLFNSEKIVN